LNTESLRYWKYLPKEDLRALTHLRIRFKIKVRLLCCTALVRHHVDIENIHICYSQVVRSKEQKKIGLQNLIVLNAHVNLSVCAR
jgi:hypothetical protein